MSFFSHTTGTAVVIRFLRDYAEFGCLSHLVASQAFNKQIATSQDIKTKRILAVKNFAELISAAEDLAGLAIAIKHREEGSGLVYGFMTYDRNKKDAPKTTTTNFYKAVNEGKDLLSFLQLPSLEHFTEHFTKVNFRLSSELEAQLTALFIAQGVLTPESRLDSKTLVRRTYEELPRVFTMVSKILAADKGFLRLAYNQTKHGFKVIGDSKVFGMKSQISEEQCLIMVLNTGYKSGDKSTGPVLDFSQVDLKGVESISRAIVLVTGAIKVLSLLVASLLEANLITTADDRA